MNSGRRSEMLMARSDKKKKKKKEEEEEEEEEEVRRTSWSDWGCSKMEESVWYSGVEVIVRLYLAGYTIVRASILLCQLPELIKSELSSLQSLKQLAGYRSSAATLA